MPFDFKKFDAKCAEMSTDDLQREWEHYTRLISGSATSTAVSGAAIPFTLGVSMIGVGLAAPAIHNARKKREIIERHLQRLGTTHHTRKRDVLTPMAISGTVGLVTLGVGSMGAGAITNAAVEHGIASVAANEIAVKATVHLAVDGVAMVGEEHHMKQKRLAEAHNAWLKQQQEKEKVDQPTVSVYDPSTFGKQSQTTTYTGYSGDMKYEYNPAPIPSPVPEPVLPPYSPPLHGLYQNNSSGQQQYSEKSGIDDVTRYYPQPSQNFDMNATYYFPTPEAAQTRPQPQPVQMLPGYATETSSNQSVPSPNLYPQQFVQQTPQLMYPSYPTSAIPDSAHQQYGRLDQVMSELTISTMPPPPSTQVNSPVSRAQTPKPPAPTSRGYCTQPQQTSEQSSSYFPPPSPIAPVSSVCYQQQFDASCLSPAITQHSTPTIPSRSPSISSIGSFQPFSPGQEQPASFSQYGYMTPVPTPGSHYDPASVQRHSSISSQSQRQGSMSSQYHYKAPPPPQTPAPLQSYMTSYPTPASIPCYTQPSTPHNYLQSPQPQPGYLQSSYPQSSAQVPNQGGWQAPQNSTNTFGPPYTNPGYPTPAATPSYMAEQQKQSMYFPPPPTHPVR